MSELSLRVPGGFTHCPDCGVALVAVLPPEPEPAPPSDDHEQVVYDLSDWNEGERDALKFLLRGEEIPNAWESETLLVVPHAHQDEVDEFVDQIEEREAEADHGEIWSPPS